MALPIAFLQMNEILIILLIVLLLFGGTKIPQLMRGVGRGMGEFQRGVEEGKKALNQAKQEAAAAPDDSPESSK